MFKIIYCNVNPFVVPMGGGAADGGTGMPQVANRVFVVDPDARSIIVLHGCLSRAGFDVQTFASAEAFLASPSPGGPACLVVDPSLPGASGLELQDRLAGDDSLSMVFVTGSRDIGTVVQAMKKGAVDFLAKPVEPELLIAAVVRGLERSARADAERRLRERFAARLLRLTPREYEVVMGVLRGLLNKQIAWELGTTEKTIKVHRGRAMEKLEVGSVAELARIAQQTQILVLKHELRPLRPT